MFYWQAKRWMASSPHLCCCCRFIIRNGGAVWKGETETERVAAFFLFLFHFFILFLRGENAAAGEACRRCFGFYCVSPSSRSTKEFLPPPSHSLTPSTPPQRPINVTSPSPCPAPPRDFLFFFIGFAFSFYFPLFLFQIPSKLQYGQVQYSKSPRVDEVIHQAFHFHHFLLICSPGLDFEINPCVSSGVRWCRIFFFFLHPCEK